MPFSSIVSWYFRKRIHQIELFVKYPLDVQKETFEYLVQQGKKSSFGKKYGFSSIHSISDFKSRVPIHNYEDLFPFIKKAMKGEKNVLWPSEVKWFAKSSGTTNSKSKFIPVTKEALEDTHYKGGKDLLCMYYNNNPETKLYKGKHLIVGGSSQINYLNNDSYFGDLSSIIIDNLPFWVEFRRTPNKKIALMENWEEKIDKMARSTIHEDVYIVAGVPSWTMILINKILEITKADNIFEIWPNFELFMHGGVNFGPYRSQFNSLIPGNKVTYLQNYNASEGFFGIQDRNQSDDMLLMLDYGIFYEFLPTNRLDAENPKTLGLDEVQLGIDYAMIITTNSGLWRYNLGDTVQFTSLSPFRIKVTGRTKHFINAFGEELMIDNAEKALLKACLLTASEIKEYTAGPIYLDNNKGGKHEWIIEFNRVPNSIEHFTKILDAELQNINSDYEAKRSNNKALQEPVIHIAPSGTFYNWLKSKNKLGGQHKVPRLANNRDYLEEILPLVKKQ